jgi:uncharacterized protein
VLNVVDFGAFVDVGLSDSGLVHISQLSAGYVRDPHDVVAVGDQVRVWVTAIDNERRRVALTMIAPGTEKPKPTRTRGPRRRPAAAKQEAPPQGERPPRSEEKRERPPRRPGKPQRDRRGARPGQQRPQRVGSYEKRAAKKLVPITKAMEEGKEFLRSFGDLLQFHQKKLEQDKQPEKVEPPNGANGAAQAERSEVKEAVQAEGQGGKETKGQGE